MAAATVTALVAPELIKLALPLIRPLAESLVVHAEHLFGAKTGPTKFATVLTAITPYVEALATSGAIPGAIDGVSVATIVEGVVQDLKSKNILNPSVSIPQVTAGANNLLGSVKVTGTLNLG